MSYDPPIPQNQYRPYGEFGPVCDSLVPQRELPRAITERDDECKIDSDCPEGFVCLNGRCVPEDRVFEKLWEPGSLQSPGVKCKVRVKIDGSIEYYDCEVDLSGYDVGPGEFDSSCIKVDGVCLDFAGNANVDLTLPDFNDFPVADRFRCNKFDPDINIRPTKFIKNNGVEVTRYSIEGTVPVTFPVTAVSTDETGQAITVAFSEDGRSIVTSGRGVGRITLKSKWDDNPSDSGTAVSTIIVANGSGDVITFTQSGESGEQTDSIDVVGGETLAISFTGLHPDNNPIVVENSGRKLCLKDGDSDDCNNKFTIEDVNSEPGAGSTLWSDDADKYAVWVNAAECTLPCLEQSVTYNVAFNTSTEYHFEFAADDVGEMYWMDETVPFLTATTPTILNPNIFPVAVGPVKGSKVLSAGTYQFTIKCTNGVINPTSGESYYFGTAVGNSGQATQFLLYQDLPVGSLLFPQGYASKQIGEPAFHNQQGDSIWWTDTNSDGTVNKYDEGVTADFNITGGSGTGLILNLTLRPLVGRDAKNRASQIILNSIVSSGNGYEIGDLLQIPGYPFDIAPIKIGSVSTDAWYDNLIKSNAVFIRTQDQPGWTSTGGAGSSTSNREVFGLSVPADSPTGKYLSFGVVDEEGANQTQVALRTCQFDMNLTGVSAITFHVRAGDDSNGAEIPNNIEEALRFSFDNTNWTKIGVPLQYSGISRSQYRGKYGQWYEITVTVPTASRVSGQTLYFEQDISGGPEFSVGYNGLSQTATKAAYQNGGDVYGIYKISLTREESTYGCNNISAESYSWARNPGGWYLKICQHTPCRELEVRPWVASISPKWGDFMNNYAVWVFNDDPAPLDVAQTLRYIIPVDYDDTLTLEYASDNTMDIAFDGTTVVSASSSFNASNTTTFATTAGNHVLEMSVTNITNSNNDNNWSNNPAGGAWKLSHSDSDGFNPFAFSLFTNSPNPDSRAKDQFNPSRIYDWAYNNDGGQKQMWFPPNDQGGFDQNGFSGYNEMTGNSGYSSAGFISSNLNEWHYMNDGGAAQLWYEIGESVEDSYEMIGGNGSGMILRIQLQGTEASGGNPNNTRFRVKEIINPGTGYQAGDLLNFIFFTPKRNDAQKGGYSLDPTPIRLDSVFAGTGDESTDFVEEEFDMQGGNGSGMRLKIRMEPHDGKDGGNNNTKYKIVSVINAGTGYSVDDELYFNFNTPRRVSLGLGTTSFSTGGAQDYSVRLDAVEIRNSRDLTQNGSTPYWHTRLVAGYLFQDTPTGNESE